MFPTFRRKRGMDYSHGRLSLLLMHGARQGVDGLGLWRTWEGYVRAYEYRGSTSDLHQGRNARPLQIPNVRGLPQLLTLAHGKEERTLPRGGVGAGADGTGRGISG